MLERLQSALKTVKESKRNYSLHFSCHVSAEVAVVGESVSHLSVCMSLQGFRMLRATLKLSRSDAVAVSCAPCIRLCCYSNVCAGMCCDIFLMIVSQSCRRQKEAAFQFSYARHTHIVNAVRMFAFASV